MGPRAAQDRGGQQCSSRTTNTEASDDAKIPPRQRRVSFSRLLAAGYRFHRLGWSASGPHVRMQTSEREQQRAVLGFRFWTDTCRCGMVISARRLLGAVTRRGSAFETTLCDADAWRVVA